MEVVELLGRPDIKILQNEDVKFSLDSILLASFVKLNPKTKNILELGSGNAPIPLYLTLRTKAKITGIEIQKEVFELAVKSVKMNMKEDQITILNEDIKNLNYHDSFDVVLSNPPFFNTSLNSHYNESMVKSISRHEILITLDEIIKKGSEALKNKGRFAMVHRPDRLTDILTTFRKYHIEPKRIRFVHPKVGRDANHVLVEGLKNVGSGGLIVEAPLYVYEEDNTYTKEIRSIYNGSEE